MFGRAAVRRVAAIASSASARAASSTLEKASSRSVRLACMKSLGRKLVLTLGLSAKTCPSVTSWTVMDPLPDFLGFDADEVAGASAGGAGVSLRSAAFFGAPAFFLAALAALAGADRFFAAAFFLRAAFFFGLVLELAEEEAEEVRVDFLAAIATAYRLAPWPAGSVVESSIWSSARGFEGYARICRLDSGCRRRPGPWRGENCAARPLWRRGRRSKLLEWSSTHASAVAGGTDAEMPQLQLLVAIAFFGVVAVAHASNPVAGSETDTAAPVVLSNQHVGMTSEQIEASIAPAAVEPARVVSPEPAEAAVAAGGDLQARADTLQAAAVDARERAREAARRAEVLKAAADAAEAGLIPGVGSNREGEASYASCVESSIRRGLSLAGSDRICRAIFGEPAP